MMMAKVCMVEGSTTGSISAGSVHYMNTEVAEVTSTPVNNRKRKRRSFSKSPGGPSGEVLAEIEQLLSYVPKVAETFNITNKIGEGTFSSVYLAEVKCCRSEVKPKFALKHIIPTSHPERIMGELQCLHKIGGIENVMGMKLSLRERDHVVIVMPYFPHDSFHVFVRKMTVSEIREYMRNLLLALRRVHQFDVIHRDIKPSNFLCNRQLKTYALVDFGLAQKVPLSGKNCKLPSDLAKQLNFSSPPAQRPGRVLPALPKQVSSSSKENSARVNWRHPAGSTSRLMELDPNTFSRTRPQLKPKGEKPLFLKNLQSPRIFAQKMAATAPTATTSAKQPSQGAARNTQPKAAGVARLGPGRAPGGAARTCGCFGLPQVCGVCTSRSAQAAPRAGTPGFRSPEVLLKCPDQTTAVDMWAAGVIFLSILSGRYPFFNAQDDMTALAQIMSVVGTEEMKAAAREYGKEVTCSVKLPAMDLKKMCVQLKGSSNPPTVELGSPNAGGQPARAKRRRSLDGQPRRASPGCTPDASPQDQRRSSRSPPTGDTARRASGGDRVPDSVYDLLRRLLDLNPKMRISAEDALRHPFIVEC